MLAAAANDASALHGASSTAPEGTTFIRDFDNSSERSARYIHSDAEPEAAGCDRRHFGLLPGSSAADVVRTPKQLAEDMQASATCATCSIAASEEVGVEGLPDDDTTTGQGKRCGHPARMNTCRTRRPLTASAWRATSTRALLARAMLS